VTNEELIQKAITAAEALVSAGKLQPAQVTTFLQYVVDESIFKNNCRTVTFRNEKMEISKIGIGNRVMFPAVEYQAPQVRVGVNTSKIELQPKEVIVPIDISDTFKEHNIEGENVGDTIMQMFAKGYRNNSEELCIRGDTVGEAAIENEVVPGGSDTQYIKDSLMAMFDGWWRKADAAHGVDLEGTNIGLTVFDIMIRQMPQKFRRNKAQLRWFVPSDLAQIYTTKIATRQTPAGDAAAQGVSLKPFGIPLVEVPLLDMHPTVVEHVTLTGTTAVALRYKPIYAGSVVVTLATLGATPTTPYIETTDYVIDYANGTIVRNGGGSIGSGALCKVTYKSMPSIILTHWQNFVIAYGRDDMRMERQRNIHKRADEYVMTGKIDVQIEEVDAMVKGYNIGDQV
jgi:hypothetical protein